MISECGSVFDAVYLTHRLLPESVVWLYANNRVSEAEQIIRNAAKLNNITMPDKILLRPVTMEITVIDDENADDDACRKKYGKLSDKFRRQKYPRRSDKSKERSARYTVFDIFRNRRLTINMFCIVLMWSVYNVAIITATTLWSINVRLLQCTRLDSHT